MERSILAEPMTAMPDFADLVPREPNGHFSNAALAAKSATGGVRTFAALENR
jgi:hypothetical protein